MLLRTLATAVTVLLLSTPSLFAIGIHLPVPGIEIQPAAPEEPAEAAPLPLAPLLPLHEEILPHLPPLEIAREVFCSEQVSVVFQRDNLGVTDRLHDGSIRELRVAGETGSTARATFYVALSTELGSGQGVRGWQLGASVSDNLVIESLEPVGALEGFERSALQDVLDPGAVHPDSSLPQGHGFYTVAGLPPSSPVARHGTSTFLRVTVRTRSDLSEGEVIQGTIGWKEPFTTGPGRPWLDNVVTVNGDSHRPCRCDTLRIEFTGITLRRAVQLFRRGHVRGARTADMADAMTILNRLYGRGGPFACEKAADVNGDLTVDLSDAVYLLKFLYLGNARPPEPFSRCGMDPVIGSPLSCERSTECELSELERRGDLEILRIAE